MIKEVLVLFLLATIVCGDSAVGDTPLFQILYTNDFHGFLEADPAVPHSGGAAHLAALIKDFKSQPTPTLLVDSGDVFFGAPPISQLLNGTSTNAFYNYMKYQVCSIGNHEFDKGQSVLASRISESSCLWLAANILVAGSTTSEWKQPSWVKPYVIKPLGSLKIGLIGLITDETPYITIRNNVKGLQFQPPLDAILHFWDEVSSQCDFIMVLAHIGMNDVKQSSSETFLGAISIAKSLNTLGKTLPLFIAAHDHQYIQPPWLIGKTLITESGAHGRHLGIISVSKATNNKASLPFNITIKEVSVDDNTAPKPDQTVQTMVENFAAQVRPLVEIVIGKLDHFDLTRNYYDENSMGNIVCDSMKWAPFANVPLDQIPSVLKLHNKVHSNPLMFNYPSAIPSSFNKRISLNADETDICFVNGGGLRDDLLSHKSIVNITWGDTFKVLPFQNTLWTMGLTGQQILDTLTRSASLIKGMLSSSGLTFEWWNSSGSSKAAGVRNVLVNGKPLEVAKVYNVVTNSFMATGGDGWNAFSQGINPTDTGVLDQDAFNDYIQVVLNGHIDSNSVKMKRYKRIDPPSK